VDKVTLGQVFSEYFGFSCQFSFHRLIHIHHLSSGAGTIGQTVADVPSGRSLTPPQETKKKKRHGFLRQDNCWYSYQAMACLTGVFSTALVWGYQAGRLETDHSPPSDIVEDKNGCSLRLYCMVLRYARGEL
jgi:hypothetical protein